MEVSKKIKMTSYTYDEIEYDLIMSRLLSSEAKMTDELWLNYEEKQNSPEIIRITREVIKKRRETTIELVKEATKAFSIYNDGDEIPEYIGQLVKLAYEFSYWDASQARAEAVSRDINLISDSDVNVDYAFS